MRSTALVVVDVQEAFDDEAYWGRRNNPECEANVGALIAAWRAAGGPIVFARHEFETHDWAFKDVVTGEPDLLVSKTVNSAFYGSPDLDDWLRSRGLDAFAVCGITTDHCVETTARTRRASTTSSGPWSQPRRSSREPANFGIEGWPGRGRFPATGG